MLPAIKEMQYSNDSHNHLTSLISVRLKPEFSYYYMYRRTTADIEAWGEVVHVKLV